MFNKHKHARKFTPIKILSIVILFITIAVAVSALVMYLWNAILPDAIGVKPISFWNAAGLLLLSKILFGGIGGFKNRKKHGKHKWKDKWMGMNHEERMEAKSRWKEHCRNRKNDQEE